MTTKFKLSDLYYILASLKEVEDGYVNKAKFFKKLAAAYNCTILTARHFVEKNKEYFDIKHGLIRPVHSNLLSEQEEDQKELEEWLKPRNKVLDECGSFMATLTPSPIVESFLLQAANARGELRNFSDKKLQSLLLNLFQEYGFKPKEEL